MRVQVFTNPGYIDRGSATKSAIESLGLNEEKVLYKCQVSICLKKY